MISVKKVLFISLIMSWTTFYLHASTNEQKIINITKNIKYISQKLANDYLYLYHDRTKTEIKSQLQTSIKKLEDDLRFIAKNTNNPDTKNILDFLSYNKDQIKETLAGNISKESAGAMLDFSDTLLEGAQSILDTDKRTLKDREKKFHLMTISKLYMSIKLGFDPINNKNELQKKIALFNHTTAHNSWLTLKNILSDNEASFIPNIVSILIKDIESNI